MRKAKKSTSKIYRKEKLKKAIRRAERLAIKHNIPIYENQAPTIKGEPSNER